MTGLAAYLAMVTAVAALMCGHQSQEFPLLRAWRARRRRRTTAPKPAGRRVPSWALDQPRDYEEAA